MPTPNSALEPDSPTGVRQIQRITRVVSDLQRAEAFYRDALGFQPIASGPADRSILAAFGTSDADEVVLRLGLQTIALVRFSAPGRPYPTDSRSNDLWFQHLAIVVSDMVAAYAHLQQHTGWQPISQDGPQQLPPSNGSVRAFKFRDPDGHPLELIWFPPGQGRPVWQTGQASTLFRGIDHSALAVASTDVSLRFYQALGFHVADRSLNQGPAQQRLDGLPDARVQVIGLRPGSDDSAGLELLAYHPPGRLGQTSRPNDGVTDWVTLQVSAPLGEQPRAERDPDGHRLILVG